MSFSFYLSSLPLEGPGLAGRCVFEALHDVSYWLDRRLKIKVAKTVLGSRLYMNSIAYPQNPILLN